MATKYQDLQEQLREDALTAAANGSQIAAPTYAGTYEDQLNDIFNKIQNREPFQYNVNNDALYQNYKDQYIQQGKLAMKDTMGQAAALTGGYGSSYGQQVGQQAYNQYLKNLSDVIPQLYGMAYDMYNDQGDRLNQQYQMVGQQRDTEYNRYRDDLSDWNYQQDIGRQLESQEYNRRISEENEAYARQQDAYKNLTALIRASGYQPTDQELAAAGMTRAAANALRNEYIRSVTPVTTSSGGKGGGGGGGGGGSGSGKKKAATTTQNNSFYNSTNPTVVSNVSQVVSNAADALAKGQLDDATINGKKVTPIQAFQSITSQAINSVLNNTRTTTTTEEKKKYGGAGGH